MARGVRRGAPPSQSARRAAFSRLLPTPSVRRAWFGPRIRPGPFSLRRIAVIEYIAWGLVAVLALAGASLLTSSYLLARIIIERTC